MDKEWRNFRLEARKGIVNPLYLHLTRYKIEPGRIGDVDTMFPNRNEREILSFIWYGWKNLKYGYWELRRDGKKYWQGQWKKVNLETPLFNIDITIHRDLHV